jgi:hypothetical protein
MTRDEADDPAMPGVVIWQAFHRKAWVRSRASKCEICGGQRALRQGFVLAIRLPLLLPVRQCSIGKFFYMLLLPEGPVAKFENGLKSSFTF